MRIGVIGINHKLAALSLREKIAKACGMHLHPFSCYPNMAYILLTTCNRTEIYFSAEDLSEAHIYWLQMLRRGVDEEFEHLIYSYFGIDCFQHLARVVSGLDSAILGESEIQGQVKQAYLDGEKSLPYELHFLFQKCLKIGKQVRSEHPLRQGLPTLSETIYHLANHYLGQLQTKKVLFVGASRINHTVCEVFKDKGVTNITFCNRTPEKNGFTSKLVWQDLDKWHLHDCVIFATKSPHYLITQAPDIQGRRFLIDLAVPRNIHPKIGSQVQLMNIDELTAVMEQSRNLQLQEMAQLAQDIVDKEVRRQFQLFHARENFSLASIA